MGVTGPTSPFVKGCGRQGIPLKVDDYIIVGTSFSTVHLD